MDTTSTMAMIGLVLPPLIALVQQQRWSAPTKSLVAMVVTFNVALATLALQGKLAIPTGPAAAAQIAGDLTLALVATKALYDAFWQPTGITPKIERATSFRVSLHQPLNVQPESETPAEPVSPVPVPVPAVEDEMAPEEPAEPAGPEPVVHP